MEAVSNYCNELKSLFSNYRGILEIMTQLLPAFKCQADHSEIQTRFLQEVPNDKTFDEPSVSAPVPLLRCPAPSRGSNTFWDNRKLKTNHKRYQLKTVHNICLGSVSRRYIYFFLSETIIRIIIFFLWCYL